ncbi:MAG: M23/M56 family metallopeptidase [Bacteroidia bacterium]|nr:M23/M56 family metallopeptidase [Bacteroidia bacterium]
MNSYLLYLFQVSGAFVCLVAFYNLLLRGLTFHSFNRLILLLFIPVALVIPVFELPVGPMFPTYFGEQDPFELPDDQTAATGHENQHSGMVNNIVFYLSILYWSGFAMSFGLLAWNIFQILQMKRSSREIRANGMIILVSNTPAVFSCFKWIFVPQNSLYEHIHPIIKHEQAHVRLFHTMDLLVVELFISLLWFNPFVYFFRRLLKSVHEFQADEYVLSLEVSKSHYLSVLLDTLSSIKDFSLSSNFNSAQIKNRINMMTKNKSSRIQSVRYVLMLPIISVLMMSFTTFTGSKPSIFPIKEGLYDRISALYGVVREDPETKTSRMHRGIDIMAKTGTPVMATASGKVTKAGSYGLYGNMVIINHGEGFETLYAHLNTIKVKEGETVNIEAIIGEVGNTGNPTKSPGPHLHYEVRLNGVQVNPESYYNK